MIWIYNETYAEACNFILKVTLLLGCFSRFWNCSIGTKSRKSSHMYKIDIKDTIAVFFPEGQQDPWHCSGFFIAECQENLQITFVICSSGSYPSTHWNHIQLMLRENGTITVSFVWHCPVIRLKRIESWGVQWHMNLESW